VKSNQPAGRRRRLPRASDRGRQVQPLVGQLARRDETGCSRRACPLAAHLQARTSSGGAAAPTPRRPLDAGSTMPRNTVTSSLTKPALAHPTPATPPTRQEGRAVAGDRARRRLDALATKPRPVTPCLRPVTPLTTHTTTTLRNQEPNFVARRDCAAAAPALAQPALLHPTTLSRLPNGLALSCRQGPPPRPGGAHVLAGRHYRG
jgi:hypothetical protein